MKINKIISLMIIVLLVSLPAVWSLTDIRNINITGSDNIPDYVKTTDKIKISADFFNTDDVIELTQAYLVQGQNRLQFNKACIELDDGYYQCTHETDSQAPTGSYGIYVTLRDDNNIQIKSMYKKFYIDGIEPEITITRPIEQNKDNITIYMDVEDKACSAADCSNKCVGLKSLSIGSTDIPLEDDSCQQTIIGTIKAPPDGPQILKITAIDKFDNKKEILTPEFIVDTSAPTVVTDSLQFEKNGVKSEYISGRGAILDMTLELQDESNFKSQSVKANFKDLFQGNPDGFIGAQSGTPTLDNKVKFKWENVQIKFSEGGSKTVSIPITAMDNNSNELTQNLQYTFNVDNIAPNIISFGTENCDDYCYVKPGTNKIIAKIQEAGSGFENLYSTNGEEQDFTSNAEINNALLENTLRYGVVFDLEKLGASTVGATNCTKTGSEYTCFANVEIPINTHLASYPIYITSNTFDDVGNEATGMTERMVVYDSKPPVLINISQFAIQEDGVKPYLTEGDIFSAIAYLADDTPVTAEINLSKLTGDKEFVKKTCEEVGTINLTKKIRLWKCDFNEAGQILTQPSNMNVSINYTFYDGALNKIEKTTESEVLRKVDTEPSFWTVSGSGTLPSKLDKQTMPLASVTGYGTVVFESHFDGAEILETTAYECEGEDDYLSGKITSQYIGDNVQMIRFPFRRRDIETSKTSLTFNCKVGLITRIGSEIYPEEQENVTITFPFYNMPLGTLDKSVEDKIKKAEGDTLYKIADKLKFLEQVLDLADKVCKVFGMIDGAYTIYSLVSGMDISALTDISPLQQQMRKENTGMWNNFMKISKYMYKACEWGSCSASSTHLNKMYDQMGGIEFPTSTVNETLESRENMIFGKSVREGLEKRGFDDVSMWPQNPEDSLILSMIALCPAGIIRNLKEYRQINCQYINCMKNEVPNGVPLQACTRNFEYMQCKYIFGEVFQIIPFMHIWKRFGRQIKVILQDPVTLLYGAGGYMCDPASQVTNAQNSWCTIIHYTKALGKIASSLEGIRNFKEGVSFDAPSAVNACGD